MKPNWFITRRLIKLSVGCYIVSLLLPALVFERINYAAYHLAKYNVEYGVVLLYTSLLGWIEGHFEFLANVGYLASIDYIRQNKKKLATISSILSILFALQTITLFWKPVIIACLECPADMGLTKLARSDLGFYLWMLSLLIVLFAAF